MWVIEHENLTEGGILTWKNKIRFRNFILGQYLKVKYINDSISLGLSKFPEKDTLFHLKPLYDEEKEIFIDSYFIIAHPF